MLWKSEGLFLNICVDFILLIVPFQHANTKPANQTSFIDI